MSKKNRSKTLLAGRGRAPSQEDLIRFNEKDRRNSRLEQLRNFNESEAASRGYAMGSRPVGAGKPEDVRDFMNRMYGSGRRTRTRR